MIIRKIRIVNEAVNNVDRVHQWLVQIANAITECPHVQIITMPVLGVTSMLEFKIGNSQPFRIAANYGDSLSRSMLSTTMNLLPNVAYTQYVFGGPSTSASLYIIWNDNFFTFYQDTYKSNQQMYAIKLSDGNWYSSTDATLSIWNSDIKYQVIGTAFSGLTVSNKIPLVFPRFRITPTNKLTELATYGEITLVDNAFGWADKTILKDENNNFCLYFGGNVMFR